MRLVPRSLVGVVGLALAATLVLGSGDSRAEGEIESSLGAKLPPASVAPDPLFDDEFDDELDEADSSEDADPFENTNRQVFDFNQALNQYFFDPLTRGYRYVVPGSARRGIRRAVLNLQSPKTLVNDLLQLRFVDAGQTLGRFMLNSTLGIGGFLDPAVEAGWYHHESDFGQTLAKFGVVSGPYLMVPVFGPTTVRDGLGSIVDLAFQPLTYVIGPTDILFQIYLNSGTGFTLLDETYDKRAALEESSIDFYAALRSAYLQNRRAKIEGMPPMDEPEAEMAEEIRAHPVASPEAEPTPEVSAQTAQ